LRIRRSNRRVAAWLFRQLFAFEDHRLLAAGVDVECEDVGSGVVADGIEHLALPENFGAVDFGVQDGFPFKQRTGEDVPVRCDDRAETATHPVVFPAVDVAA
jgi:hypothetical protein